MELLWQLSFNRGCQDRVENPCSFLHVQPHCSNHRHDPSQGVPDLGPAKPGQALCRREQLWQQHWSLHRGCKMWAINWLKALSNIYWSSAPLPTHLVSAGQGVVSSWSTWVEETLHGEFPSPEREQQIKHLESSSPSKERACNTARFLLVKNSIYKNLFSLPSRCRVPRWACLGLPMEPHLCLQR